jgi:hypothetical protein
MTSPSARSATCSSPTKRGKTSTARGKEPYKLSGVTTARVYHSTAGRADRYRLLAERSSATRGGGAFSLRVAGLEPTSLAAASTCSPAWSGAEAEVVSMRSAVSPSTIQAHEPPVLAWPSWSAADEIAISLSAGGCRRAPSHLVPRSHSPWEQCGRRVLRAGLLAR